MRRSSCLFRVLVGLAQYPAYQSITQQRIHTPRINMVEGGVRLEWEGVEISLHPLHRPQDCAVLFIDHGGDYLKLDACDGPLKVTGVRGEAVYRGSTVSKMRLKDVMNGRRLDVRLVRDSVRFNPMDQERRVSRTEGTPKTVWTRHKRSLINEPECPGTSLRERYYVRVRAFADYQMYLHYLSLKGTKYNAKEAIKSRIRSDFKEANLLFKKRHMDIKYVLVVESVKIMVKPVRRMQKLAKKKAVSMNDYLDSFRDTYASQIGPKVYHIILFTANHNFRKQRQAGLASFGRMCDERESVSIVKYDARQRGVNLVHEIAHSLGMSHDGENGPGCPKRPRMIMSADSTDRIRWSHCSNREAKKWLGCFDCFFWT